MTWTSLPNSSSIDQGDQVCNVGLFSLLHRQTLTIDAQIDEDDDDTYGIWVFEPGQRDSVGKQMVM